jgi:hypothetical protein
MPKFGSSVTTQSLFIQYFNIVLEVGDRLCGLVVTVPGYSSGGPEFDSRRYHILCVAVGLERYPLSLVRINEELFERESSGSGLETSD